LSDDRNPLSRIKDALIPQCEIHVSLLRVTNVTHDNRKRLSLIIVRMYHNLRTCALRLTLFPVITKVTAATAITYRHKYNGVMKLNRPSENTYDSIMLCSAILFLAGKSTENIRRIREVLNVVRHLYGFKSEMLELRKVIPEQSCMLQRTNRLQTCLG
jgi:hypothetical protein